MLPTSPLTEPMQPHPTRQQPPPRVEYVLPPETTWNQRKVALCVALGFSFCQALLGNLVCELTESPVECSKVSAVVAMNMFYAALYPIVFQNYLYVPPRVIVTFWCTIMVLYTFEVCEILQRYGEPFSYVHAITCVPFTLCGGIFLGMSAGTIASY